MIDIIGGGSRLKKLCLISGANWNNGSNAGVRAVNLNNNRTNSNNNVGFRADSISHLIHQRGDTGNEGGGFQPQAKPCYAPLSGSNYSERQRGDIQ